MRRVATRILQVTTGVGWGEAASRATPWKSPPRDWDENDGRVMEGWGVCVERMPVTRGVLGSFVTSGAGL
jgi:hypothetical protein